MTVPAKGGRPRKWRSDADRVRAFRARQRGDQEPATLDAALVDGDELARAVDHISQLQVELAAADAGGKELEAALAAEQRRTQTTRRRLERLQAELDALRTAHAAHNEEVARLADEIVLLKSENAALRLQCVPGGRPPSPGGPNRTARRNAAKQDRGSR